MSLFRWRTGLDGHGLGPPFIPSLHQADHVELPQLGACWPQTTGAEMSKFVNMVGDIVNPYFFNFVAKGQIEPTAETPEKCFNVFDFRRLTNVLAYDPVDVLDVIRTAFISAYVVTLANQKYRLFQCEGHALDDPTSATAVDPTEQTGANEDDLYAGDTALYMQFKSGFRGRSFMGSKHWGALNEVDVDNGYLTAGGVTAWGALKTAMQTWATTGIEDTAGNRWHLCIVSRTLSNLEASPAIFTGADITSILMNKRVGTMGSRRGNRDAV